MLVPMFVLLCCMNHDGTLARMADMRHYFSVECSLSGPFSFYELIKVSYPTWDGYKTREEKQEG